MRIKALNFSDLFLHPDYRWDSDYLCFEPYKNKNLKYIPIGDTLTLSQYGISIEMNEGGIGTEIYRMNEIGGVLCDRDVLKYAELNDSEIRAYKLCDRDILFNRTNSQAFVGRTAIFRAYSKEDRVFASYLVRVRPNPDVITPEYLTAFLNTKYGVLDVKRRARISINQSNVNPEELKRVAIPLVSKDLQQGITGFFDTAFELTQSSDVSFNEAQTLLLSELGLTEWRPKHCSWFVADFSATQRAGRIDADYFQPKYGEIVQLIKSYHGGWNTLGSMTHIKDSNFVPVHDTEHRYIELANIAGDGRILDCNIEIGQDLPSRARRKVTTGDVIVSSIEGSLSSIALIGEEYDQALCSTGFYVISSETMNPETLYVLLKSHAGQLQLKQGCNGTILTSINKDAFGKIVLPLIVEEVQAQIQQMVAESAALHKESNRLLECAKRAVEIAIEEDESTALNWLKREARG